MPMKSLSEPDGLSAGSGSIFMYPDRHLVKVVLSITRIDLQVLQSWRDLTAYVLTLGQSFDGVAGAEGMHPVQHDAVGSHSVI